MSEDFDYLESLYHLKSRGFRRCREDDHIETGRNYTNGVYSQIYHSVYYWDPKDNGSKEWVLDYCEYVADKGEGRKTNRYGTFMRLDICKSDDPSISPPQCRTFDSGDCLGLAELPVNHSPEVKNAFFRGVNKDLDDAVNWMRGYIRMENMRAGGTYKSQSDDDGATK